MTAQVIAVRPDDPLMDAAAAMAQRGVRHLPVVDTMGRVVGILSDRDVRSAIGMPSRALGETTLTAREASYRVIDAMTPEPRTLRPDEPLAMAGAALIDDRIGALPVVDDDDLLVGIISYIDALQALPGHTA